ncbi:hypothetical protein Peur_031278 [Populus x canadensis]
MDPNIGLLPLHLSPFPFPSDLSGTTASSSSASPSTLDVFMPLNSHLDKPTLKHKNRGRRGRRREGRDFYP